MSSFKPTWLYIKQHNKTGLVYFGKTVQRDPVKYAGSGTKWKNHLAKHGNDVTTIWYCLFLDAESVMAFAKWVSNNYDIVKSSDWANLKEETGLNAGGEFSDETRQLWSSQRLGKIQSPETIEKRVSKIRGKPSKLKGKKIHNDESKAKLAVARLGNPLSEAAKDKLRNKLWSELAIQTRTANMRTAAHNRIGTTWTEDHRNARELSFIRKYLVISDEIFAEIDNGASINSIAKLFALSWSTVSTIVKFRNKFEGNKVNTA